MLKMHTFSYHHFFYRHLKMSAIIMEEFLIRTAPLMQDKLRPRARVDMVRLNHALNQGYKR